MLSLLHQYFEPSVIIMLVLIAVLLAWRQTRRYEYSTQLVGSGVLCRSLNEFHGKGWELVAMTPRAFHLKDGSYQAIDIFVTIRRRI